VFALASTRQNKTLTEHEAKQVLGCCGAPIAQEILVGSLAEALVAASKIGFPVVLKISSPALLHKSRVGGVRIGIRSIAELEKQYGELVNAFGEKSHGIATDGVLIQEMIEGGYELILGGVRDKSFGPVIMVGAGGILAESIKDVTFRLAPVDASESLEMLREIKLFSALAPSQYNEPGNIKVIEGLCRKMSHLLSRFPEVEQIDLNPVVVTEKRVVVVDAKIVLS
jgi:succinyl-CoA synthetase beta subunit